MKQFPSKILSNKKISNDFYQLKFEWHNGLSKPEAGQFVTLKSGELTVPLLRRPFAVSAFDEIENKAEIIYQKRGDATNALPK